MAYEPLEITDPKLERLITTYWILSENKKSITREFIFDSFISAFAFMTEIALKSEKLNHHPEWHNVYNNVKITWSTHELDGLSHHDLQMAQFCDHAYCK